MYCGEDLLLCAVAQAVPGQGIGPPKKFARNLNRVVNNNIQLSVFCFKRTRRGLSKWGGRRIMKNMPVRQALWDHRQVRQQDPQALWDQLVP